MFLPCSGDLTYVMLFMILTLYETNMWAIKQAGRHLQLLASHSSLKYFYFLRHYLASYLSRESVDLRPEIVVLYEWLCLEVALL